jgi:hypothetical protein
MMKLNRMSEVAKLERQGAAYPMQLKELDDASEYWIN